MPRDALQADSKMEYMGKLTQEYCPLSVNWEEDPACKRVKARMGEYHIPEGVHAMSGGSKGFVTGGLYNSDLVLEALEMASGSKAVERTLAGGSVLDWGGSSGRSIAMMKAAFPTIDAHVADPIRKSIKWVNDNSHLRVQGYASPINPPVSYSDKKFDLIFAISIWSHYNFGPGEVVNGSAEGSGLRWLKEMRRIIKSDGHLVITTHGWVASFSKVTDDNTSSLIRKAFESRVGEFYVAAFPGNVDWDKDTKNPDWGMSWVDPAWLAKELAGQWQMKVLLNGRNDCLQDVIVLVPV